MRSILWSWPLGQLFFVGRRVHMDQLAEGGSKGGHIAEAGLIAGIGYGNAGFQQGFAVVYF